MAVILIKTPIYTSNIIQQKYKAQDYSLVEIFFVFVRIRVYHYPIRIKLKNLFTFFRSLETDSSIIVTINNCR